MTREGSPGAGDIAGVVDSRFAIWAQDHSPGDPLGRLSRASSLRRGQRARGSGRNRRGLVVPCISGLFCHGATEFLSRDVGGCGEWCNKIKGTEGRSFGAIRGRGRIDSRSHR